MSQTSAQKVETIPVDMISVVNPRARNQPLFIEIVTNIKRVGLKRPVTVTRQRKNGTTHYNLVCGQGRLEAYQNLGETDIPAIIVDVDEEDCLVMSLVENCARRQHNAVDLLSDIGGLKKRGYNNTEIAEKTGLSRTYIRDIIYLLENGEHRLLRAVESGQMPIRVAMAIVETDDAGVRDALQSAYEDGQLRGQKLMAAKRVIEQRRSKGKGLITPNQKSETTLSPSELVRAYREDTDKKRALIQKSESIRDQLIFIVEALRTLLADEHFLTLLRAEQLDSMPLKFAERAMPTEPI